MILIISHPGDTHSQNVARVLTGKGCEPFLLDYSRFTAHSSLNLHFEDTACELRFHDDLWGDIDLHAVNAVWWRRPQQFQISSEVCDPHHRMFAMAESREVFGGLSGLLDSFWVNVPERDDLAHRKGFQLRLAQKLGFRIPHTLISNSQEAVRQFIDSHADQELVFKAFSGSPQAWRETRLIGETEKDLLATVKYAPVIFQQYIQGIDIRVTVVGEYLFAAEIDIGSGDYAVDFRMNYDTLHMQAIELPNEVEALIRKLMARLGLVYGAIDFRRTPDNQYVFLEINPAGQWLFVEHHTKQPITDAMAKTLIELDQGGFPPGT